jgi:hypothetical protein
VRLDRHHLDHRGRWRSGLFGFAGTEKKTRHRHQRDGQSDLGRTRSVSRIWRCSGAPSAVALRLEGPCLRLCSPLPWPRQLRVAAVCNPINPKLEAHPSCSYSTPARQQNKTLLGWLLFTYKVTALCSRFGLDFSGK